MLFRKSFYFVLLPWIVGYMKVPSEIMYTLSLIGLVLIIIFSPSATKSNLFHNDLEKEKIKAIAVTLLLLIISVFLDEPYQQLMLLGITIIAILPNIFP